jgi:hypothetical protein
MWLAEIFKCTYVAHILFLQDRISFGAYKAQWSPQNIDLTRHPLPAAEKAYQTLPQR